MLQKLDRSNERNIIGYALPGTDDTVIGKTRDGKNWIVHTPDGFTEYTTGEIKEVYYVDLPNSDLERLGWPA